jgi:hypothetical protein
LSLLAVGCWGCSLQGSKSPGAGLND